ncbi:hypothetical protein [Thalassotalea profundi]|uniref:Uncharacterized protein n=1 Tax=Thalassotalea profundi TaxID=2036687 RepID=A0ABQ3J5P6_9GAMM|nr:hypothetical protein [Thalassotalea profundi]GHF02285.1 hypothetical protein GCM10011501_34580 [Thalassotalea profundi]
MLKKSTSDTKFTAQVKLLLDKLYGRSALKDSLVERAIEFFAKQSFIQHKLDGFKESIAELKAKGEKKDKSITRFERDYRDLKQELRYESNERYKYLYEICLEILKLSEGMSFDETNRKSAQLLGTIQLVSPTEGKKIAEHNERNKPLYKAILTLRLFDQLFIEQSITLNHPYLKEHLSGIDIESFKSLAATDKDIYQTLTENIKIPILMAALIQDIGNYHPDAQEILKGKDGKLDMHRTLPVDERKALLQINYSETVKFMIDGLGAPIYVGNSKTERDKFNIVEHQKLVFIKQLIKGSIAPRSGIGNLLKVPQIYTSIILSTKPSYNYKLLPKVYQALYQNAEHGSCCKSVVDALYKITGTYPQGYGVTYIPFDSDGEKSDRYEYAIVTQLYPENGQHPVCRTATRYLTFIGFGQDVVIHNDSNLYNVEVAQQFATLSKERLNEILELLASNYADRKKLDLLPRYWHAGDYFSVKDNQKLWNKSK